MQKVGLFITFVAAWYVLDRLATSPPMPLSAAIAVAAAGLVVGLGEVTFARTSVHEVPRALGLTRPSGRALIAALCVGLLVVATFVAGAAILGITLQLRDNWPAVLVGALLFHGVAEELVWRGFVFGHLRRRMTFRRAVLWSIPLIALTHVAIIVSSGWLVGGLALVSAAVTCLPLAYLYERGGQTIWAPAIVHGLIGTWQLFERTYPASFSVVVLLASIVTPLTAFAFGDRFFKTSAPAPASAQTTEVEP